MDGWTITMLIGGGWLLATVGFVAGSAWASAIGRNQLWELDQCWQKKMRNHSCPECLERLQRKYDFESECG